MADEVKEGLTGEEVETPKTDSTEQGVKGEEENVDDYFNPFADISDEDKEIEKDIKKESEEGEKEVVEKEVEVEQGVKSELAEIKAQQQATKEVAGFIREHPEFEEMSEELVDLASKATVRGHSKSLEFAVRNVKSPSYWVDYGKKIAREDLVSVAQNRVGGASLPKGGSSGTPDFSKMPSSEFNKYVRDVMNGA